MAKHDDLLNQGPQEAPEPETAEQRTKRTGWGAAGGGVAAGGIGLAKFGAFKFLIWFFAFRALSGGWRIGGWAGLAVVIAAIAAFVFFRHERRRV